MSEKSKQYLVLFPIVKSSISSGYALRIHHEDPGILLRIKDIIMEGCAREDIDFENHPSLYDRPLG